MPDLSVIIVNYNTREDLGNCLASIQKSKQDVTYQIWVVDNNSSDSSVEMVRREYPSVRLIENPQNGGFAQANNLAIRQSRSVFVLLLNPDTIIPDYAFDQTIEFLKNNPEAGMVGCKLVKRDGSLDLACRRSFPSMFDGFSRAIGFSKLFPKTRVFARYNLTYLDENEKHEVDAINGAFMMVRRRAIEEVGLLDEDYFMYIEDLDWCYRFKQKGWKVFYIPEPKVIHLKGQSGKKNSGRMIREFFKSMEIFYRKNYLSRRTMVQFWFTVLGIKLWKSLTLFRNSLREEKRVTP